MKSDNPNALSQNRRNPVLYEVIFIFVLAVVCGYFIFSQASKNKSPAAVAQLSQPTYVNNAISSTLTTSGQVALFENIWTAINDNFLYTDFNGLDWSAIRSEYIQKISAGLSDQNFYQDMETLVDKLGNDHTRFIPPWLNNFDAASIGLALISLPGEDRELVTYVYPNGSAARAGILPRDRILAVDGKPTPADALELVSMINGVPDTKVDLTVQTPGQEPRQVELTREYYEESYPVPYKEYTTSSGKHIGYLLLISFDYGSLREQIIAALIAMSFTRPLDGLIVDVRANPGGKQLTTFETISIFTHGIVGYFVTRDSSTPIDIPDREFNGSGQIPLVVLISPVTNSGGGIFAGILQDRNRAYLVGEKTGKALDGAHTFSYIDHSLLMVANAAIHPVYHPDQNWIETGIAPDLEVKTDWNEFMTENDPVIRAAVEYFDR